MIVRIVVQGDAAVVHTGPSQKEGICMTIPAYRVRPKFKELGPEPLIGFFAASLAVTRRLDTNEDIPLDVLQIGDRVPTPEKW